MRMFLAFIVGGIIVPLVLVAVVQRLVLRTAIRRAAARS